MNRWWRFYIDNYFPYIYGLMLIENEIKRTKQLDQMDKIKKEFTEKIIEYLDKNQIFYIKQEMEDILKFDINAEFRSVLLTEYYQWPKDKIQDIIEIVNQTFKRGCY